MPALMTCMATGEELWGLTDKEIHALTISLSTISSKYKNTFKMFEFGNANECSLSQYAVIALYQHLVECGAHFYGVLADELERLVLAEPAQLVLTHHFAVKTVTRLFLVLAECVENNSGLLIVCIDD